MIVADASVVLLWLLEDPPHHGAQALLDHHLAGDNVNVAPELLTYEVANVLATKSGLSEKEALEAFDHFLDLQVETYTLGTEEYRRTIELSRKYSISVYDASYLALSMALETKLATADKKLHRKIASLDFVELVL